MKTTLQGVKRTNTFYEAIICKPIANTETKQQDTRTSIHLLAQKHTFASATLPSERVSSQQSRVSHWIRFQRESKIYLKRYYLPILTATPEFSQLTKSP